MSISWGAQYPKLKTNLRLAINRLQLLGKKKTEMAMKARTEIADYISVNKPDRARIRVEHIIREDYVVEAFEILEMYCDLLLARFGLIEQMKTLDDGIAEAVISVMWAAPRLATDIAEFKTISDQLTVKYGKPFAEAARANQLEFPAKVNPKLVAKLSAAAPPKLLVERYLIEIAAAAQIAFTPDPDVMREDEVHQAEQILIDFKNAGGAGGPGGPPPPPSNNPYGGGGIPPPPPPSSGGGGSGYGWSYDGTPVPQSGHAIGTGVISSPYMPPKDDENIYDIPSTPGNIYEVPARDNYDYPPDSYEQPPVSNTGVINLPKIGPNGLPIYSNNAPPPAPSNDKAYPPLSQRNSLIQPTIPPNHPTAPPQSIRKPDNLDDLNFPVPPTTFPGGPKSGGGGGPAGPPGGGSGGSGGGGDLDFDDLAKRFDALKKRNN